MMISSYVFIQCRLLEFVTTQTCPYSPNRSRIKDRERLLPSAVNHRYTLVFHFQTSTSLILDPFTTINQSKTTTLIIFTTISLKVSIYFIRLVKITRWISHPSKKTRQWILLSIFIETFPIIWLLDWSCVEYSMKIIKKKVSNGISITMLSFQHSLISALSAMIRYPNEFNQKPSRF